MVFVKKEKTSNPLSEKERKKKRWWQFWRRKRRVDSI